jgi:predicted  nucleic acid-binding Zn-ribbon protein
MSFLLLKVIDGSLKVNNMSYTLLNDINSIMEIMQQAMDNFATKLSEFELRLDMIQYRINTLDSKLKQIDDFIDSWDSNDVKRVEMIHSLKEELKQMKKNITK